MLSADQLRENLDRVRGRIAAACERVGRDPHDVALLPVTKKHPPELIATLLDLGLTDFGENRPQELRDKDRWFRERGGAMPRWHLIGNLQRNKAKYLIGARAALFHALDSVALAKEIETQAARDDLTVDCLVEVNVSGEAAKHGLAPDGVADALRAIMPLPRVRVRGLMTMAPFADDPETTRPVFRALRERRDALQEELDCPLPVLSMGMTNDFETAIEEGATLVRLGTALLGPRPPR